MYRKTPQRICHYFKVVRDVEESFLLRVSRRERSPDHHQVSRSSLVNYSEYSHLNVFFNSCAEQFILTHSYTLLSRYP